MRIQIWLLLLLPGALLSLREHQAFVGCSTDATADESKGQASPGSPAGEAAPTAARNSTNQTVQHFCGGPEDLRSCDSFRDGVCVISARSLQLWRKRRWRGTRRTAPSEQHRWVEGLRIRASGDIELRDAQIQCTHAAPAWRRAAVKRRRSRGRGFGGQAKQLATFGVSNERPQGNASSLQRIELCATGSIRLLGASKIHCAETILFAGDSVTVAETAEVSASGTAMLRGLQQGASKLGAAEAPSFDYFSEDAASPVENAAERVVPRLRRLLGMAAADGSQATEDGIPYGSADAASPASSQPHEVHPEGSLQGSTFAALRPSGASDEEFELRGGSHGGLGGVASDRCEAKVFSHPLRVHLEARGNLFLPFEKGEAGLLYTSRLAASTGGPPSAAFESVVGPHASIQTPRGGGLVVVVALRRLALNGQVTSSGEPGWGCGLQWLPSASDAVEPPAEDDVRKRKGRNILTFRGLRILLGGLLGISTRRAESERSRAQLPLASTCATAGSGGSIVLVSESLTFASPMQSGRVAAAGGGCLSVPPGMRRSAIVGSWDATTATERGSEVSSGECAAGGGGRIAVYAEQPHPLDPVIMAPGGCALRSSRIKLLPCLCGGGGTVFSRVHRRLVIANKLTAVGAAASGPPSTSPLSSRSQLATAAPHTFGVPQASGLATAGKAAQAKAADGEDAESKVQSRGSPENPPGSTNSSSGSDALAVLSVQPTPLPVPLHAPLITVAIEAAVVTLGGAPARMTSDTMRPCERREPKVVVGSLVLQGGTRGSALHVLKPLHLHAAEGSIRLRQRSALVLAPCGSSGGEKTEVHLEASCHLKKLPQAGIALGASVVVSSALSISVGEGAAIRFTPMLRSFRCGESPEGAVTSSQQGMPEEAALGVGLLAGERLLLHGVLGLVAAPSDCLPAPVRTNPLLLFAGNEVSVRGEQQLDRLIVISQGTVSFSGKCVVGHPNRCSDQITPLVPAASSNNEAPMRHSAICRALEEYGNTRVAPQLDAVAEAKEQLLNTVVKSSQVEEEDTLLAWDKQNDARLTRQLVKEQAETHGAHHSGWASSEDAGEAEGREGWFKKLVRHFGSSGNKPAPSGLPSGSTPLNVKQPVFFEQLHLKGPIVNLSSSHLRQHTGAATDGANVHVPVASHFVEDAVEALETAQVIAALLRKKPKSEGSLEPLAPFDRKASFTQWGPTEPLQNSSSPDGGPSLLSEPEAGIERPSPQWDIPSQDLTDNGRWKLRLRDLLQSWPTPGSPPVRRRTKEPSVRQNSAGSNNGESLIAFGGDPAPAASVLPEANDSFVVGNGNARGNGAFQGETLQWDHLDAAIFASKGLLVDKGALLQGGALLLCGGRGNALLNGTVDVSQRGCQPTHGPGAGTRRTVVGSSLASRKLDSSSAEGTHSALCGAGGGGHVGSGGNGVHALTGKPCTGTGGAAYDRGPPATLFDHPQKTIVVGSKAALQSERSVGPYASTASASGGGGDLARAGSGGGVVWVQGRSVTVDGMILADGGGGELMQDAIIDVDVDPQSCPTLGSSPTAASKPPKDEAQESFKEQPPLSSWSSSPADAPSSNLQVGMDGVAVATNERPSPSALAETEKHVQTSCKDEGTLPNEEPDASEGEVPLKDSVPCQLSGILSDPAQLGQGGGGGGSIVIETGSLLGSGIVSAQGGHGGLCTGGGGGGGAINFIWNDFFYNPSIGCSRQKYDSGKSHKCGDSAASKGQCLDAGLCGSVSNRRPPDDALQNKKDRCSLFVPWLRPLEFAAGFSGSVRVAGGGSDPSGACGPLQLPLGNKGTPGEVRNPLGCPPGYAGWRCSPCPVGFYSFGKGRACLSCSNKPSNDAFYTREGVGHSNCPYACTTGLPDAAVNPGCLPPLLFVIDQLLCWSVLIPLGAFCLALVGLAALIRELSCMRGQQGWSYGSLLGLGGHSASISAGTMENASSPCGFGLSPSNSLGIFGGSTERRRLHLAVQHLTLEDLPFHVLRIYLHGRNSPHSPWGLDGEPPPFLGPLITPHRFAAFATAANSLCGFSRCFVQVYNILSFLYPPLAALLLRAARARRAERMIALCSALAEGPPRPGGQQQASWQWGARFPFSSLASRLRWGKDKDFWALSGGVATSFWRSIRAREISFALKFGCDPDCTLGFIDVLDLDRNILDYRCSPQLPLVLLAQGDGRVVPFSLSRSLRESGASRAARRRLRADSNGSPADPLQTALEELASPSVWGYIANFFSAKVKELAAEELAAMRALLGAGRDGAGAQGGPDQGRKWRLPLSATLATANLQVQEAASAFPRCGRCGRLQLPSMGYGRFSESPSGLLMGDSLYALRAVGRLCEGVRLLSDRILRPHGIAARVCVLATRGLICRTDGVKRLIGKPHAAHVSRSSRGSKSSTRQAAEASPLGRQSERPFVNSGKSAPAKPLDTGRLLLRAASSPSALLDSLRRNAEESSLPYTAEADEASHEGLVRAVPGRESTLRRLDSRHGVEQEASTTSFESLGGSFERELAHRQGYSKEERGASVETDAVLALVITEDASDCGGAEVPVSPRKSEATAQNDGGSEEMVVLCFPPVSSLAVTSPLDPRRLSPSNKPLAPYIAAAGPALPNIPTISFWATSGVTPMSHYSNLPRCPSSSRLFQDRQAVISSTKYCMPSSFKGVRRISNPFNDSHMDYQGITAVSPHGTMSWGPTEPLDGPEGPDERPVLCLADATKRSAGADAQRLRSAVEALQKSALAKLGTGQEIDGTVSPPDDSLGISRVTTAGVVEQDAVEETHFQLNAEVPPAPQRSLHPLALLQRAWRQLRFKSPSTDLARTYVLTAALAIHILHMAVTCVYLYGLKNTSFTVAWPQPFPQGTPAGDSVAWAVPVNSFWFRGKDPQVGDTLTLVASPPMEGPGVGPSAAGNAVAKWSDLVQRLGGSSWGLIAVALTVPPFADVLCFIVGLWLFLAADAKQEQLFCMTVAATMPKHIIVCAILFVYGASLIVALFGLLELIAMAALKMLLCMLASMYASRLENPYLPPTATTKESELHISIAQVCSFLPSGSRHLPSAAELWKPLELWLPSGIRLFRVCSLNYMVACGSQVAVL
ncbi:hypothetical protein Efla_003173 [Eimeria flavescens]